MRCGRPRPRRISTVRAVEIGIVLLGASNSTVAPLLIVGRTNFRFIVGFFLLKASQGVTLDSDGFLSFLSCEDLWICLVRKKNDGMIRFRGFQSVCCF